MSACLSASSLTVSSEDLKTSNRNTKEAKLSVYLKTPHIKKRASVHSDIVCYLSNKARGGVVYGQYTTAKGCSRTAEWLDTVLSRGILAIYHKPLMPYC